MSSKHSLLGGCVALALCLASLPAFAGNSTAAGDWSGNWGFNTADQDQLLLNRATLQNQAGHGGPVGAYSVTNIYGNVNNKSIYNGTVNNSGATNMNNVSSTSTYVHARNSKVNVSSSTDQSSDTTDQNSTSDIDIVH